MLKELIVPRFSHSHKTDRCRVTRLISFSQAVSSEYKPPRASGRDTTIKIPKASPSFKQVKSCAASLRNFSAALMLIWREAISQRSSKIFVPFSAANESRFRQSSNSGGGNSIARVDSAVVTRKVRRLGSQSVRITFSSCSRASPNYPVINHIGDL